MLIILTLRTDDRWSRLPKRGRSKKDPQHERKLWKVGELGQGQGSVIRDAKVVGLNLFESFETVEGGWAWSLDKDRDLGWELQKLVVWTLWIIWNHLKLWKVGDLGQGQGIGIRNGKYGNPCYYGLLYFRCCIFAFPIVSTEQSWNSPARFLK